jgi:ligand-binding sensor domain-containing protein
MDRAPDGRLWCAAHLDERGGWVWRFDPGTRQWDYWHPRIAWGLEPAEVQVLRTGPGGEPWLATDFGVMAYLGDKWTHVRRRDGLPRQEIYDVAPVRARAAWVASRFGLALVRPGEENPVIHPDRERYPVPARGSFTALAVDRDTLYAAGAGMLLRRVGTATVEGPWEELERPAFTTGGSAVTALFARDGRLAVADRNGFAWRTGSGEWRELLPEWWDGGVVLAIERHGGVWWLGTDRGLVKLETDPVRAVLFGPREGLPGERVFAVEGDGDHLWLGTDRALTRFLWKTARRID